MKATVDSAGRIVVPRPLRDAVGLVAGSTVDITSYGIGLYLAATGEPRGSSTSRACSWPPATPRSTTTRCSR